MIDNNSFATVYPQIADRLAELVPALGWIDMDQDQLENEAQEYPLPYDQGVALISFDEMEWSDRGQGVQRGDATIRVSLAIQVVQDSYQHSSQRAAALRKLQLLGEIHAALHHYGGEGFGALVRTYSRKEPANGRGLWVYSQGYRCELTDAQGYHGGGPEREATDVDTAPEGAVVLSL